MENDTFIGDFPMTSQMFLGDFPLPGLMTEGTLGFSSHPESIDEFKTYIHLIYAKRVLRISHVISNKSYVQWWKSPA